MMGRNMLMANRTFVGRKDNIAVISPVKIAMVDILFAESLFHAFIVRLHLLYRRRHFTYDAPMAVACIRHNDYISIMKINHLLGTS